MEKKQLTTYQELQEDKAKLESDIENLIDEFTKHHGMFGINFGINIISEYSVINKSKSSISITLSL